MVGFGDRGRPSGIPRNARVTTPDLAANLARNRGWALFPCREDKRPATPHGFLDAVLDPAAVADLWQRYPGPLIGVATGARSSIDVLDIDVKHEDALRWWQSHQANMPPTRTFRT